MNELIRQFIAAVICMSLFFFFSLWNCEAPHKNPLDPQNPDYGYATLKGKVMSASAPDSPLANVMVSFPLLQLSAITDHNGNFEWREMKRVNGWIYFKLWGYFENSLFIDWQGKNEMFIQHDLYKMPGLTNLKIYSIVFNRYPDIKRFQVSIRAQFTQPYDDIDSVMVLNNAFAFRYVFAFDRDVPKIEIDFTTDSLGLSSIQGVIGHPFEIQVIDKSRRHVTLGSDLVERIIIDEAVFISPANAQVVQQQPVLQWQALEPGFRFTYLIEVYSNDFFSQLEWARSGISSNDTSVTVGKRLTSGDYFWVIWCVDEFNNRSRSKPASFKVE